MSGITVAELEASHTEGSLFSPLEEVGHRRFLRSPVGSLERDVAFYQTTPASYIRQYQLVIFRICPGSVNYTGVPLS